jgi:hypothetical protein
LKKIDPAGYQIISTPNFPKKQSDSQGKENFQDENGKPIRIDFFTDSLNLSGKLHETNKQTNFLDFFEPCYLFV